MIKFTALRWKNILSTGNVFTELKLDEAQTTIIMGKNGAGKSTVIDALSFVLFGKPFRKINKPQLLNSITQKNLRVEVEFNIGPVDYKIIRGMKPNVFEVYQDGSLLNQSAEMKDYQSILEKNILKVNHNSFCQIVILGSATFQPFMQLTTGQRREIIEDLLDLQIFTTMNSVVKDKLLTINEDITDINTNKKILENKIQILKEYREQDINSSEKFIQEKKSLIGETNKKIESVKESIVSVENEINSLSEKASDLDSLNKRLNKLNSLKHKIEANLAIIKKDITFFEEHQNCPTCQQSIEDSFKDQKLSDKVSEKQSIEEGLIKLSEEFKNTNEKIDQILKINSEITEHKLTKNSLKTKLSSFLDYKESLEKEIEKANSEKKDYSEISKIENELKILAANYNNAVEEKNTLQVVALLLKDGGIKSKIIKQYIPIMNNLINKYLANMEFMCNFELDENFNETIKSRYRDVFSYSSFSEGEKMRINLAILFAWRAIAKMRNSINTNLLIMDEVFDSSLDSSGTEEFIKIINDLTIDTNTFIISHKTDQLSDKFERVIEFEKYKNFSRLK